RNIYRTVFESFFEFLFASEIEQLARDFLRGAHLDILHFELEQSFPVDFLHLCEIAWRFRLVTCQFFDEGILIIVVEYPIVPQLIAHCGKRDCTERLAACTAGTMTGPD